MAQLTRVIENLSAFARAVLGDGECFALCLTAKELVAVTTSCKLQVEFLRKKFAEAGTEFGEWEHRLELVVKALEDGTGADLDTLMGRLTNSTKEDPDGSLN